jgi:hypothetical protein
MTNTKYKNVWLAFVQIKPEENYSFEELIESDEENEEKYMGAWANILVKADTINEALEIIPQGLKEKNFEVVFIDKIENVQSLVEYEEIDLKVLKEIDWLLSNEYVFMISDKIFPYAEEA